MLRIVTVVVLALLALAAEGRAQDKAKDYVCGTELEVAADTLHAEAKGVTFYFCSAEHQAEFKKSPDKCLAAAAQDYAAWLDPVFVHYFAIREDLAGDRKEKVAPHAKALARWAGGAARLAVPMEPARKQKYQVALVGAQKSAATMAATKADLDAYRKVFKDLSNALIQYMREVDAQEKSPRTAFRFYCSMAKGSWFQASEEIGNPYYGESMLTCGRQAGFDEDEKKLQKDGQGGHGGHGGHGS